MRWICGIAVLAALVACQVSLQADPDREPSEPKKVQDDEPMPPRDLEGGSPPGRQDSTVSLEWVGPNLAQVGQVLQHTIRVRNTSTQTVHKVQLKVRLPESLAAKSTKPEATTEGDVLVWQLGTLLPGQEKSQQVDLMVISKKDVTPQAWVTYTGLSAATHRIRVHEPKLALKVSGPGRVMAGDPANFLLTVTNAGECVASQVKVHADLSDGLEHARGKGVDFEIGDLAIGESRAVQLVCVARAEGKQKCEIGAGAGGYVKVRDSGVVEVIAPKVEVQLTGPGLRYVDRQAKYTVRVVNGGEVAASNVTVEEVVPAGFKFLSATAGGRHTPTTQTVSWFLGEVGPGESREVEFELMAIKSGEHKHQARAFSERGIKNEARTELVTRIEDFSALSLDLAHADDTLEVGKDTTYEILVSNTGSQVETGIKLVCTLPEKMELKSAQGPTRYQRTGDSLIFEPVPRLTPRGEVVYQIKVKALSPGDVRFKSQVTSSNLIEPVIKTSATRIYSDRP